jgi:hypothetical protein
MAIGETVPQSIASQVSTGTTSGTGERRSADSAPSDFRCPDKFIINRDSVVVHELDAQGSEHSFNLTFGDFVDLISGVGGVQQPTSLHLTTHARSSRGNFGGKGAMSVKVDFNIVQFRA